MLKIAWTELYAHPLPEGHRFPMEKYELVPHQLLHEGLVSQVNFFSPDAACDENVLQTHTKEYFNHLKNCSLSPKEVRKIGFPLSERLVTRELQIIQGTLECALHAMTHRVAANAAGGTHHAYSGSGEGFCLLNDIAFATNILIKEQKVRKVFIVDLDVHQGNGTAQIFSGRNDVFTFSMHGEKNYPMYKEKSSLDIELPDGADDSMYLDTLKNELPKAIEKFEPDFVFYQAGVDILKTDKLGRLGVSREGCKKRDDFVFQYCRNNQLPVVFTLGGGYSEKISDIVEAHANTFRSACEIFY
ncbi:MAG: histone deacetylase [Bacteroidia bacterium]